LANVIEEVGQRLAGLVFELLFRQLQLLHAIEAEAAEALPQLAPRRHRPARAPEEQPERPHRPLRRRLDAIDVAHARFTPLADRASQCRELARRRLRHVKARREQRRLAHAILQPLRQHRLHLLHHGARRRAE